MGLFGLGINIPLPVLSALYRTVLTTMHTTPLTAILSLPFSDVIPELSTSLNWPALNAILLADPASTPMPDDERSDALVRWSEVFHDDILGQIAYHTDWATLMALRHCPDPAPSVVGQECRRRVFLELSAYIPDASLASFFDVLSACKAAMVGPIARRVMQQNGPAQDNAPLELNIVTTRGYGAPIYAFITGLGYELDTEDDGDHAIWGPVSNVEYFTRRDPNKGKVSIIGWFMTRLE